MTAKEQKAIDCAIQHIKVFRQQHLDDVTARLGQSCEEQLGPLLKNTDKVKLTAAIYPH